MYKRYKYKNRIKHINVGISCFRRLCERIHT